MFSHGFVDTRNLSLRLGCRIYRLLHGKIIFDEKCPDVLPEAARHRRDDTAHEVATSKRRMWLSFLSGTLRTLHSYEEAISDCHLCHRSARNSVERTKRRCAEVESSAQWLERRARLRF